MHTTAELASVQQSPDNLRLAFRVPPQWMKYVLPKGFIALNGCSLTVHLSVCLPVCLPVCLYVLLRDECAQAPPGCCAVSCRRSQGRRSMYRTTGHIFWRPLRADFLQPAQSALFHIACMTAVSDGSFIHCLEDSRTLGRLWGSGRRY